LRGIGERVQPGPGPPTRFQTSLVFVGNLFEHDPVVGQPQAHLADPRDRTGKT
jgi:hypothetical protein